MSLHLFVVRECVCVRPFVCMLVCMKAKVVLPACCCEIGLDYSRGEPGEGGERGAGGVTGAEMEKQRDR